MDLEFFAQSLAEICAHSLVSPGRPLRWAVIVNPTAGGFTIKSRWKEHQRTLEEYRQKAQANPLRENSAPAETGGLSFTSGPGSGGEIAGALIAEAGKNFAPFYLIITAGGDGTSLEVLSAMYSAPAHVRNSMAVLRLPMGTGNDGADCAKLADALELLIKPVRIEFAPAVRLVTAPDGPVQKQVIKSGLPSYLAFNILSVGLDSFVTHMTNKMKGKLPGDSYKLWVDIAALLYDRIYKVDYLDVRVLDGQNREISAFRGKVLLLAVGASGHRTYGAQKKILPDARNICVVRQMPLLRKLALKGLFTTGAHIDKPESILFSAHRVEFSGSHPILAQMDGETVLLHKEDFPAAIELTAPVIPFLSPVS
ncbi:diacylglycerol kinase [Spirochaetia bacterium]|nr:diacylglycerol kinase [Spirochaetia bacterium]